MSDLNHSTPSPPAPPSDEEDDRPPRWWRVWSYPVFRTLLFAVGAWMALRTGASAEQTLGGCGLMVAAAGGAAAEWISRVRR